MLLKDLLNKYDGEFCLYEDVYNGCGNLIDNRFIANHKDFIKENKYTNKIKERKIHRFEVGKKGFLNIYLECKRKITTNIMDELVGFLELSTYVRHALFRADIYTVGELCNKTYRDVHNIRCIGEGSMEEIVEAMKVYGLHFKEEND